MNIQFSERLPSLKINEEKKCLIISHDNKESELVTFYERFLGDDIDYFSISREYASGLYEMIELISRNPEKYGPFLKGHTTGPVTFAAGITGEDGKSILYNPDLLEATTKGLAIKALWQAKEIAKSGKKPIIFLDEPYLSGFGSVSLNIERHEVINLLKEVMDYLRERSDGLIGIHCCGNTDWSMIIEAGPDIINFDAFSYMDYFLLYPEHITRFVLDGGIIAWGIVPTTGFSGNETADVLFLKLEQGLKSLYDWGLAPEMVMENSIITPACGMGTMEHATYEKVLNLLSTLSELMLRSLSI